ncbi:uncharacterized protein LOC144135168 [Amblyomma americanum]
MVTLSVTLIKAFLVLAICGAVLVNDVTAARRGGKRRQKRLRHSTRRPEPENSLPNENDLWNDAGIGQHDVSWSSEEEAYSAPTLRLVHPGGLLPPVLAHASSDNLTDEEALEPVTVCGPGWHAPTRVGGARFLGSPYGPAKVSFSGVQFFFGQFPAASLPPASQINNIAENMPDDDSQQPLIVT